MNSDDALPDAPRRQAARRRQASQLLPVSGGEEVFADVTYGAPRGRGNNNCYAWAIGDYRNGGGRKLQPGNLSGAAGDLDLGSCAAISARAAADLKGRAYREDADVECRAGYYKVMAFLDKGNDYHWYKQHRHLLLRWPGAGRWKGLADAAAALGVPVRSIYSPRTPPREGDVVIVRDARLWSHKRGFATGPLLRDSCGKPIRDPRAACRDYGGKDGGADYADFCGAMCVRSRRPPPARP